jgi:hypothetical protein
MAKQENRKTIKPSEPDPSEPSGPSSVDRWKQQERRTSRRKKVTVAIVAAVPAAVVSGLVTAFFGDYWIQNNTFVPAQDTITCASACGSARHLSFVVPAPPSNGWIAIILSSGKVMGHNGSGDVGYGMGNHGPDLGLLSGLRLSTEVDVSKGTSAGFCALGLLTHPARKITSLAAGDYFCAETTQGGIGVYEITRNAGGRLSIKGFYWPPVQAS